MNKILKTSLLLLSGVAFVNAQSSDKKDKNNREVSVKKQAVAEDQKLFDNAVNNLNKQGFKGEKGEFTPEKHKKLKLDMEKLRANLESKKPQEKENVESWVRLSTDGKFLAAPAEFIKQLESRPKKTEQEEALLKVLKPYMNDAKAAYIPHFDTRYNPGNYAEVLRIALQKMNALNLKAKH